MRLNGAGWWAAIALLAMPAASLAASVSGVVLDPQDLAVRGARVAIVCTGGTERVSTDVQGRFALRVPSGDQCVLSVRHTGFAVFRQAVDRSAGGLVIRLQVASVEQHVHVVAAARGRPAPGSVVLSSDETDFRSFAASTTDLIRYARLLSGTSSRSASIYIDGLPAGSLPPLDAIARISINADAFSAEHADGDAATIEIITRAPARTLRFFTGGDVPAIAGRDVLSSGSGAKSRFVNFGIMGPVPRMPLTFSANAGIGRSSQEMPILVELPEFQQHARTATASNRSGSGTLGLYYAPTSSLRARVSLRESRARDSNVGVGGVTLQEGGLSSSFVSRESRATATKMWRRLQYEGGAAINHVHASTRANAADRGITIGGEVALGGVSVLGSDRRTMRWTSKHVVRSSAARRWSAGIVLGGADETNRQTPNPAGVFHFPDVEAYRSALAGGRTGIWYIARGGEPVRFTTVTAAPFVQAELIEARRFSLAAGLRADYQSEFGTIFSPRVSFAAQWHGVGVRAGAGVFVQRLPAAIFTKVLESDARYLEQFVATEVSLAERDDSLLRSATAVTSRIAGSLTRPRAVLWRTSIERALAGITTSLEYSSANDRHLLGSDRRARESEWVDVFESNRSALRRRLHAHARRAWKRQLGSRVVEGQLAVDYEFTHARDNTDGPFSFPERPGDVTAEWARSAGIAPHDLTVMATFSLPAAISVNVVDVWRSGSPFNITTALDAGGNGLVVDRGGQARNSGNGPAFHSLSAYAHRRLELSDVFKRSRRFGLHVSVQADNLLDNRNYLAIGTIAGSTTFGKPLAAYPGRSVRVLLSVD